MCLFFPYLLQTEVTETRTSVLFNVVLRHKSISMLEYIICLENYRLMPHLKYIIENAPPELRQLRGKTLECFSLIGLAVGRGKVSLYFTIIYYSSVKCAFIILLNYLARSYCQLVTCFILF